MKILVTGAAGFIGYHLAQRLCQAGHEVVGVDNLTPYYDVQIKKDRLKTLPPENFHFHLCDLSQQSQVEALFAEHHDFEVIVHLAAQAGVRYSIENPHAYVEANIYGQLNLLEAIKQNSSVKQFIYASSSSVYGANSKLPFSVKDPVENPISFYAVTKRSCELMAESYHQLYGLPMVGLRFFTVYGPWGRPDMATYLFTKAIFDGQPLKVFNQGKMRRNFSYIDDVTDACQRAVEKQDPTGHKLYNIGNNKSESLMDFIHTLEKATGQEAILQMEPMQAGDVKETIADISETQADFGFEPKTNIDVGLANFVTWYKEYYSV